jgi:hypothetical protein
MSFPTVLGALLLLLVSVSSAQAAAPKKKHKPDAVRRVTLVIWGGGKTPADAELAAKDFTTRGFKSSAPPVQLFSSEVRGLNPGFHIAVLGACSKAQGYALLRRARQFYPAVYMRAVPSEGAVAKLACPDVTMPRRKWYYEPSSDEPAVITGSEEVVFPSGTLKVEVEATIGSNSESVTASYSVKAQLTQGDTVLDEWTHSQPDYATVDELTLAGKSVVLTAHDARSDCKSDSFAEVKLVSRRLTVKGEKIVVKEQLTGRESELCSPDLEGAGRCMTESLMAKYNATRAACEDATREDCMKAIADYDANTEPTECDDSESEGD